MLNRAARGYSIRGIGTGPAVVVALVLALLAAAGIRGESVPAAESALELVDCRLQHPERLQSVAARCGFLEVAENPDEPAGKRIRLKVAVVPAVDHSGPGDPLFVLAGGPGQAASEFYTMLAGAFAEVRRSRDIVLVDQRGTGESNALSCPFPEEDEMSEMSGEQIRALTQRCLEALSGDPRFYTTTVAVQDLERVRAALGYGQINLYGVSYGTRVAQHYLRRFPEQVRAIVLDGVVPPGQILGVDSALQAQRALDLILERCRSASACHKAFPDPAADLQKLQKALGRAPAEVTFADPVTAAVKTTPVQLMDVQMAVRLLSYNASQAALLPLLLHEGATRGNLAPLAAQSQMIQQQLGDSLSVGMHNAVVCTEDAPYFDDSRINRAALERSYLGPLQLDVLRQTCAIWPRGVIDDDFHESLDSQVPALLLSGSADPVTPPAYAEQALQGLHNARHIVMEGQGHGQITIGCMPRLVARFIDRGSLEGLDVSCAREARAAPFFVSFSGPAP